MTGDQFRRSHDLQFQSGTSLGAENMPRFPPANRVPIGYYELTTHLIALAVMERGYSPYWIRRALFLADIAGRTMGWNMTRCVVTSTVGAQLTTRKDLTRRLLQRAGLSVAHGGIYASEEMELAAEWLSASGAPAVVKPAAGSRGRGVAVGVQDRADLEEAWAGVGGGRILVETQFQGDEARFLTVGGECIAVAGRRPANVVGDGHSTVANLVEMKNRLRADNPHLGQAAYRLPSPSDPSSIPALGQRVVLDRRGGFHSGADSVDMTDRVHSSFRAIAEAAEQAFPGLGLAGIDIMSPDFTRPAEAGRYIIVEVNSRPAIGAHHFPWEGTARDVAGSIVDYCLRYVRSVGSTA